MQLKPFNYYTRNSYRSIDVIKPVDDEASPVNSSTDPIEARAHICGCQTSLILTTFFRTQPAVLHSRALYI